MSDTLYEATFLRVEHKYPLSREQYEEFLKRASSHLIPDVYPEYDLHNLYFDTENNDMVIHCMESPLYKEKLRMRSYGTPSENVPCFLEIKKKYKGLGSKRRICLSAAQAQGYLEGKDTLPEDSQIASEITYLVETNHVSPKVYVSYHRKAFSGKEEKDLRITFDTRILYRDTDLSMAENGNEIPVQIPGDVLMEIKFIDRYPLWLSGILTDMKLYRYSFSKYGEAYAQISNEGGHSYVQQSV